VVEDFLTSGATGAQTAAYIGVCDETLYDRVKKEFGISFSDYSSKFKSRGEGMLHVAQFKKAMKLDNTMMVWLGKNRLGQRDTPVELGVTNETMKHFGDVLNQLKSLRSEPSTPALKIEDTNSSAETKS
jgi:hypothetical protein